MLDFFRGTLSADAVLDYLSQLPRTSAYQCAIADDEELAARWASEPTPPPGPPPLREFSPEAALLADIYDLLAVLLTVTAKAAGGKPGKPKPRPRPVTAIEKARRRLRYARHSALADRLLGGRPDDSP